MGLQAHNSLAVLHCKRTHLSVSFSQRQHNATPEQ